MKEHFTKLFTIFRMLVFIGWSVGIYHETGIFTAVAIAFIFGAIELLTFIAGVQTDTQELQMQGIEKVAYAIKGKPQ